MKAFGGRSFWDAKVVVSAAAAAYHDPAHITAPYAADSLDLTLFISCYNEEDYIIETLDIVSRLAEQAGLTYELIVIDDNSRDRSRDLVSRYIADHPGKNIVLRANARNKGLAQNYLDAAFLGRGRYYRLICGDHAELDGSTLSIFQAIGSADIVIPYYTHVAGKNLWRRSVSNTFTTLINTVTGNKLHYYNGLAVHLRRNVMRWGSHSRGFGFQADTLCRLLDLGFDYKEIPVTAIERRKGVSNAITTRNLLSVMHTLMEIAIRRLANRVYRRR